MSEITFLSPEALPEKVARKTVSKWDKLRRALIENKGQYALFGEYDKRETANQRAGSVRTGSGRWVKGAFEAVVTQRPAGADGIVPDGFAVYVRFVGTDEQAAEQSKVDAATTENAPETEATDSADEFGADSAVESAPADNAPEVETPETGSRRGRK